MNNKIDETELAEKETTIEPPSESMLKAHKVTLVGYWALVILIPIWNLWWYPSSQYSNKTITVLWLIPLMFPMFGLLKGKAYTHAWSGFIAVIYICHGLASLVTSMDEIVPIILEVIFASMFLGGGMIFARWRGVQLGLQLPKKK